MQIIKTPSWIQQKNEGDGFWRNLKSLSSVKSVTSDSRKRNTFESINLKCILTEF
jgi:hypothetical protein